jgi:hypothetical protein
MLVASEPVAAADASVDVILGLAVLLAFAGVVVRAFVRWHPHVRARPETDGERPGTGPGMRTLASAPNAESDLACEPCEPVAEASEPQLARLRPGTLAPLARALDRGRRLGAAEARIAGELAALPEGFWLVERNVCVDGRRIPFLVIGATGVFLICASDGAWTLDDLQVISALGDQVGKRMPGHDGVPHAAVCLAFERDEAARLVRRREAARARRMGPRGGLAAAVDPRFGPECGLRNGDVRALDEASGPFWDRRSTARLPITQNFG